MTRAVIISGARTAIGSFGGALKDTPTRELGRVVIESAIQRAGTSSTGCRALAERGSIRGAGCSAWP